MFKGADIQWKSLVRNTRDYFDFMKNLGYGVIRLLDPTGKPHDIEVGNGNGEK
jgi:hypothetical protein